MGRPGNYCDRVSIAHHPKTGKHSVPEDIVDLVTGLNNVLEKLSHHFVAQSFM
jgi:hypothetical protein